MVRPVRPAPSPAKLEAEFGGPFLDRLRFSTEARSCAQRTRRLDSLGHRSSAWKVNICSSFPSSADRRMAGNLHAARRARCDVRDDTCAGGEEALGLAKVVSELYQSMQTPIRPAQALTDRSNQHIAEPVPAGHAPVTLIAEIRDPQGSRAVMAGLLRSSDGCPVLGRKLPCSLPSINIPNPLRCLIGYKFHTRVSRPG